MSTDILTIIKESFETWYNQVFSPVHKISVVINYSDRQFYAIKAIHTACIEVQVVGIKNHLSFTTSLFSIKENYNHGVTSEESAKEEVIKRLLVEMYNFQRR